MTHATLTYYDGNVYLKTDGNPLAVEIDYKGLFNGESSLPNGFILTGNKGKILIIRMVDQQFPESLFSYLGEFSPKKVVLYQKDFKLTGKIDTPDYRWAYMSKSTNNWNLETSYWQSFRQTSTGNFDDNVPIGKNKTNIITNNIKSVSGNLVTRDGKPYYGDVHYHSAGYFMTGGTHSEDSVRLYRKNGIRIKRRRNG